MILQQQQYYVAGKDGPQLVVGYYITPVFAVHFDTDRNAKCWVVTHVPTGLGAGRITRWENAVELAAVMSTVPGIEQGQWAVSDSVPRPVIELLGTIRESYKQSHPGVSLS
jgi:hypothetical protein